MQSLRAVGGTIRYDGGDSLGTFGPRLWVSNGTRVEHLGGTLPELEARDGVVVEANGGTLSGGRLTASRLELDGTSVSRRITLNASTGFWTQSTLLTVTALDGSQISGTDLLFEGPFEIGGDSSATLKNVEFAEGEFSNGTKFRNGVSVGSGASIELDQAIVGSTRVASARAVLRSGIYGGFEDRNAIRIDADGEVDLHGGAAIGNIVIENGGTLRLHGSAFSLNGQALDADPDGTVLLARQGGTLRAVLQDGQLFGLALNADFNSRDFREDYVDGNAILELVAAESTALAGDFDGSGSVEQADLDLVLTNWGRSFGADLTNWSRLRPVAGSVDQAELDAVLLNWGSAARPNFRGTAIPEPIAAFAALGAACVLRRRTNQ